VSGSRRAGRHPGWWSTVGTIAVTIGALLGLGVWTTWQRHRTLAAHGVQATAQVRGSSFTGLDVEYVTAAGEHQRTRITRPRSIAQSDPLPATLPILYDRRDPGVAEAVGGFDSMSVVTLGIPGLLLTIGGLIGLIAAWRAADNEGDAATEDERPDDEGGTSPTAHVFPIGAVGWAIGGFVVSYAAAFVAGRGLRAVHAPLLVALLASQAALWAVLFATCVTASRRWGTGSWRSDFSWSLRGRDLWGGIGVFFVTFAAALVAIAPLVGHRSLNGSNTAIFDIFRHNTTTYAVVAALGVIGAPVFEELFFRGLLYQGFTSVVPVVAAAALQGALFGLAHTNPALGTRNTSVVVGIAAMGFVLGLARHYYRRLGPGIVGHGLHNLVVVLLILARR
jgi:membrane protease YdiL (CAAX protease family)